MRVRHAVAILLTPNPDSADVYLVRRNEKLRFFGGYDAFVGGTIDEEDHVAPAGAPQEGHDPFVVTAARELFEETGILLVESKRPLPDEKRRDYRRQILDGKLSFHTLLQQEQLTVAADAFHHMCSILTPEFSPVRYDTRFYWAQVPEGQSPEIWEGELVDGGFFDARTALQQWKRGERLIVPPVLFMLKVLSGSAVRKAEAVIGKHAQEYQEGRLHEVYFTPGVQLIALKTRTLLPATHTNTYLVGEGELYIIDPAPSDSHEQDRLWNYLDERLTEGKRLKGILLTHHHPDHVGAVEACQKRYRIPLLAHPKTAEKLPTLQFETLLQDGDRLALGAAPDGTPDWQLLVFHTPGHAWGHLAFKENRYGAVIAGDLISTLSTIVINPPDGHMATYMKSLHKLLEFTESTLYPSHGPAVRNGKAVIQQYIRHREMREQKLVAALGEKPQTTHQLVQKVYDDVEPALWPLAELSLQAGLIKLLEEGRCRKNKHGYLKADK